MILGRKKCAFCQSLIFCLLLDSVSSEGVTATVGSDVTLPCKYDANYYGKLSVCWGRGEIPRSGCANEVIRSDQTSVISSQAERYLLSGDLSKGDVSLTIRQVKESDSGVYGCRVDIPGWFNDHKHQQTLTVVAGRPNPLRIETREVKERTITVLWTPGFNGGKPIISYRIDQKNKQASWDTAVRTEIPNPYLTQVSVVDLHPAKTYNLRMFAINSVGISEASNVLTVTTKEAAPEGPPLDVHLEGLTSHSVRVTWKPPRADLRNGVLRSYSISYREYDAAAREFKRWQYQSVVATTESIILTNLKPSTTYGVIIQAKTNAGVGPASAALLCSTLDEVHTTTTTTKTTIMSTAPSATAWIEDTSFTSVLTTSTAETVTATMVWEQSTSSVISVPPDPPVLELKEVIQNTISLSWIPGFEGDSPITGYYLEYKTANAQWDYTTTVIDFSPDQTEATIIEVNPSTYNIRMFAKNSLGTSKASNVLTITTGETGHQRDSFSPTTPMDNSVAVSSDGEDLLVRAEESHSVHQAAIVVPVLLVLTVAIIITWQIRRIKKKQGSLSMGLVANRSIPYQGAQSLQEL